MSDRMRVYVDMVGDLFHPGHVELLRQARSFGDWLIVGVLSDDVVAGYKRRPIMTLDERVDVVTTEFLAEHHISLVVHGNDISDQTVEMLYGDVAAAGKLRLVHREPGISTTEIIRRVQDRDF